MKIFKALTLLGIALLCVSPLRAQEGEAKPVDEVVARVNADFILKSAFLRAQQDILEELKAQGLKDQELEKKFNELKNTILDSLIDQTLLVQRAKELSLDVEAQVNEQLVRFMKESGVKSVEELEQRMRESGMEPNEVRRNLRNRFLMDAVRNKEVLQEIYFKLTEKDKREYYDKHKEYFTVPGEISLCQIFIASGKDPQQAQGRAKDVVALARANGADFSALVERYTEDEKTKPQKGCIGSIPLPQLRPEVNDVVGKASVGTITDPIKIENGFLIFRVSERKEPELKPFENEEIQRMVGYRLTEERGEGKFETYLAKLRSDAFIEIDPRYQSMVSKTKSAQIKRTPYTDEKEKKKKDKDKKDAADANKDGSKVDAKTDAKTDTKTTTSKIKL